MIVEREESPNLLRRVLSRWREKVVFPEFLAPQMKESGGGEVTES